MPPTESPSNIPNIFADFFLNKIQKNQGKISWPEHKKVISQEMLKIHWVPASGKGEKTQHHQKYESNNLHH